MTNIEDVQTIVDELPFCEACLRNMELNEARYFACHRGLYLCPHHFKAQCSLGHNAGQLLILLTEIEDYPECTRS